MTASSIGEPGGSKVFDVLPNDRDLDKADWGLPARWLHELRRIRKSSAGIEQDDADIVVITSVRGTRGFDECRRCFFK